MSNYKHVYTYFYIYLCIHIYIPFSVGQITLAWSFQQQFSSQKSVDTPYIEGCPNLSKSGGGKKKEIQSGDVNKKGLCKSVEHFRYQMDKFSFCTLFSGCVPLDPQLSSSMEEGKDFMELFSNSATSTAIGGISQTLLQRLQTT